MKTKDNVSRQESVANIDVLRRRINEQMILLRREENIPGCSMDAKIAIEMLCALRKMFRKVAQKSIVYKDGDIQINYALRHGCWKDGTCTIQKSINDLSADNSDGRSVFCDTMRLRLADDLKKQLCSYTEEQRG